MNVSNNTSPAEGIPLGSLTPGQDPAVHDSNTGAENFGASGLPRAMLASGIPRIVIMDENAVYDHYMRRLNRVWMRRIQVGINNFSPWMGCSTHYLGSQTMPHVKSS